MTTSQHLQLNLESLTSSQEDSPVKTYQLQAFKKVLPKKPDQVYFTNSSESYAWYDPNTLSWKTWQRSLIEGWTLFSGNFPKQGMMQNGQLYQQVLWEPVINDQGGGSLPTPTATEAKGGGYKNVQYKNGRFFRTNKQGVQWGVRLTDAVLTLPTPTASDVEGGIAKDVQYKNGNFFRENKQGVRWGVKLRDAVSILPTPTTMDHLPQRSVDSMVKQVTKHRKGRTNLANLREAVNPETVQLFNKLQSLPTPTARDYKDSGENMNYKKAAKKGRLPGVIVESRSTQTGKDTNLNPHFVEEMMGYPIGWTDLKH